MMQLDIFHHSRDVMLRNELAQALQRRDAQAAGSARQALAGEYPEDPALADASTLIDALTCFDTAPFTAPAQVQQTRERVEKHVAPANRAHQRDFLKAIAARGKPVADIEEGHISTSLCELGNISQKLGRSLTWDAEKQQVVGDAEANKLLRRPYREPWVHPEPDKV